MRITGERDIHVERNEARPGLVVVIVEVYKPGLYGDLGRAYRLDLYQTDIHMGSTQYVGDVGGLYRAHHDAQEFTHGRQPVALLWNVEPSQFGWRDR
jgi:hypothetical protein